MVRNNSSHKPNKIILIHQRIAITGAGKENTDYLLAILVWVTVLV